MNLTEPVQDFEAHCASCLTCQAAQKAKPRKRGCDVGEQLGHRAIRSLRTEKEA